VRLALAILVVTFTIIADLSYQGADRVRAVANYRIEGPLAEAIEDWEIGTYFAVGLGLAGVVWVAAAIPSTRTLSRFTHPFARYGAGGAIIGGLILASIASICSLASGAGPGKRHTLEEGWLIGASLGGLVGSAIGGGIGAAAYGKGRTKPVESGTAPDVNGG